MKLSVAFIIIGAVLLTVFLSKRVKQANANAVIIKSFVSISFMAAALSAIISNAFSGKDLIFSCLILSGLLFGLLGDIWLDFKYVQKEFSDNYTYIGFMCFLIGHIFYDAAMIYRFYIPGNVIALIIPLSISAVIGILVIFSEDLLKVRYGKFKAISAFYGGFLISLIAVSFSLAKLYGFKCITLDIINIAGVLFGISDAVLNGTYFGTEKNRPVDIVVNHTTYYAAQFAIAFSLCFLAR